MARRMFSLGRFRRNPAGNPAGAVGALRGAVRVGDWGPLAVTGGLAAVATGSVPLMLGIVNPWFRYGAQIGTAFLGGWAAGSVAGREHGKVFTVVGTSLVVYDLLKNFVFARFFPGIPLGDYDTYEQSMEADAQQVGAGYPENGKGNDMSAYPEEVGAYPEEVGAYPYDGQYGY